MVDEKRERERATQNDMDDGGLPIDIKMIQHKVTKCKMLKAN